jgi:choline dehydrogenase
MTGSPTASEEAAMPAGPTTDRTEFDYIVVGSGAGGGPVACNLARAGYSVLLLEAGDDSEGLTYQVPAFHGLATEDPALKWDYFVQHYEDPARQKRDSKYVTAEGGILYPRAGTLGGCTAHNAMITVYPHNSDWDHIAELTGDPSWRAEHMRKYFERLEQCQYILKPGTYPKNRWRAFLVWIVRMFGLLSRANPAKHGWKGWLTTNEADPLLAIHDTELLSILEAAAKESGTLSFFGAGGILSGIGKAIRALLRGQSPLERTKGLLDPNDWRNVKKSREGLYLIPLATAGGQRVGTREHIRAVEKETGGRLRVQLRALVSRVLFDPQSPTVAVGVEYVEGPSQYRADPRSPKVAPAGTPRQVYARREVILSGGAFNTPQLLMLSGIGPAAELQKHGIATRVDLPGVGRNLQDRYEVGVISEATKDFAVLGAAKFDVSATDDPVLQDWQKNRRGLYTSNGAVVGIIKRSKPERPEPDLFIFGLPGFFRGYFPGYSKLFEVRKTRFTWAILKAHTRNTGGFVRLKSPDPRDTPEINFKYFDEGTTGADEDVESVAAGVRYVEAMSARLHGLFATTKLLPAKDIDTDAEIKQWIKDEAWGHHASCTCKIGRDDDPMAVLDSRFRVRGAKRLRVVDASVFPRIPGFFIVTPVYMIAEKASDVIIEDAKAEGAGVARSSPAATAAAG